MSNGGRADGPLVLWSFGLNGGLTGGREREMADSNILIMTISMLMTMWMMMRTIFVMVTIWTQRTFVKLFTCLQCLRIPLLQKMHCALKMTNQKNKFPFLANLV